ncbi:MAG: HD domain-containing protein [Actinobacteria bacterium]|nr:HD domain-containing protein [Actinomycetota bacterium]
MVTGRFDEAVVFALQRHRTQTRKSTAIPYAAHLLAVASLVMEHGGDEDQAIAALLHDSLEDRRYTGVTYGELVDRFGARVAGMVRECSDSEEEPKPPWRDRKARYLASLRHHSDGARLVAAADKLHNLRSILTDYRVWGEQLWERFDAGSDQLWYYRELVRIFTELESPLAADLRWTLEALEAERSARRDRPA